MADNPKLTVLFEKLRGKVFELTGETMSCGRKDGMDICIKDGSLSSHHCDFIRKPDGNYILRDNGSTNGTRVNNIAVTEQELKSSDILQLGSVEVLYDCPIHNEETAASRTHTIEIDDNKSNFSTVTKLVNFSPFAVQAEMQERRNHKMIVIALCVLGVAVLGLIVFLLLQFAGSTPAR